MRRRFACPLFFAVGIGGIQEFRFPRDVAVSVGPRVPQQPRLVYLEHLAVDDAVPARLGLGDEPELRACDGGESFRLAVAPVEVHSGIRAGSVSARQTLAGEWG